MKVKFTKKQYAISEIIIIFSIIIVNTYKQILGI